MRCVIGFALVALAVCCAFGAECGVEVRLDCHPEPGATQSNCESRGCCWRPASGGDPLGTPWCFFGTDWGYTVSSKKDTDTGFSAILTLSGPNGPYGDSVKNLALDAHLEGENVFHFTISDANNSRYRVPIETPVAPKRSATNYDVAVTDAPFGIVVTRKATKQVVFDSTIGGLTFQDQFLSMSTRLSSRDVYGLGEHVLPFALNTSFMTLPLFARDQGTPIGPDNLYGTFPYYINMEPDGSAHGVFLLNSNAMEATLQPDPAVTFRTIGGVLDMYVFLGPTADNVVQQFNSIVGNPYMPPYWALGFHLCRWGYDTLDELKQVSSAMRSAGIPQDVQWSDIDYMHKYLDFTFDHENFAGLPEFVDGLHAEGMRYVMIVDPGISSEQPEGAYEAYDEGLAMDVFIKNEDGENLIGKVWPGLTAFPDFFHPNATAYWAAQIQKFHDEVHFDGLWIDMNEPANFVQGSTKGCPQNKLENPPYVPRIKDGQLLSKTICMSARQAAGAHYDLHSLYGLSEMVATKSALDTVLKKRAMVVSRSTFPSAGRYGSHWLGDNTATWDDLYYSIPGILNFNMFGIPLVGPDICGFNGDTTEELCTRWMLLGAFYPFSRNHNTIGAKAQDPTAFGPTLARISRDILLERYRLLPFLYTLFHEAHVSGSTVVRPLAFEFPQDSAARTIDKQFLWGSSLLISPALTKGATTVDAYFPNDIWFEWFTGAPLGKTGTVTLPTPADAINVHVRGGAIIPLQEPDVTTTKSRTNPFELRVALGRNGTASGSLFLDDGESFSTDGDYRFAVVRFDAAATRQKGSVVCRVTENKAPADTPPLATVRVLGISNKPAVAQVDGKKVDFDYDATKKVLVVHVPMVPFATSAAATKIEWST